jgi:hypothetical protein
MGELGAVEAIRADIDVIKGMIQEGYPPGTTPFSAQNGTAVAAAATPQEVVAAPGAGIRIAVKSVVFTNPTNAEIAVLDLQDEDDNLLAGPFIVGDPAVQGQGERTVKFDVPLRLPVNKALEVHCTGDLGDSFAFCTGWTETV